MSLSRVLGDRGSKERAFVLGCSPVLMASTGRTADMISSSLGFGELTKAPVLVQREHAVDAGTIGTAFDYSARFELGGFDPQSTVAFHGLEYLQALLSDKAVTSNPIPKHERDWLHRDDHALHKFRVLKQALERSVQLLGGTSEDRNRAAILMAWCEQVFRIGTRALEGSLGRRLTDAFDGEELAASIDSSWLRDLAGLSLAARPQLDEWLALSAAHADHPKSDAHWSGVPGGPPGSNRPFYLPNPGFLGSALVGGADGDWIIGDTLIDCKTDQAISTGSLREHLLQLIGYVLLDLDDWYQIRKVAIFYPRFGLLPTWSLDSLLSGESAELLPKLRDDVRKSWGKREALAVHQPSDKRRIGVLLAQNLNTPFEMLAELVETTSDVLTLKHVANNRSTPLEVLRHLAVHPESTVREQVAKNTATPVDVLLRLQDDRRINVRRAAVSNPNLPIEVLLGYANDPTYQAAAAANAALPVERLLELARDSVTSQVDLRRAIAKNPSATPHVLAALNYWDGEATLVLRRAEMTPELVAYIYASDSEREVEFLQHKLRQGWSFQAIGQRPRLHMLGETRLVGGDSAKRARLAWLIATGTSIAQLRAMTSLGITSGDDRVTGPDEIAATVLSGSPEHEALRAVRSHVSPAQLRDLARHGDSGIRAGVALNPDSPRDVLAELLNDPDELVRRVRAWNPSEANYVSLCQVEAEIAAIAGMHQYSGWELDTIMKSFRSELQRTWRAAIKVAVGRQPRLSKLLVASTKADKELGDLERKLLRASSAREAELTRAVAEKSGEAVAQRAALQTSVLEAVPARRPKLDRVQQRLNQIETLQSQQHDAAAAHAADKRFFFEVHPEFLPQLEATARSVDTAPEIVARLAELRLGDVSVYAALNQSIEFDAAGDIIAACFKHSYSCSSSQRCDPVLSRSVAGFPGSPMHILERLALSCGHAAVRSTAAAELRRRGVEATPEPGREPFTEVELAEMSATDLTEMAASSELLARAVAAGHPDLPTEVMIWMASDPRADVRKSLAKNPSAPTEILDFLGGEKSIQVRRAVASHPSARPELLEQLAGENDYEVHWRLSSNIGTPSALLARLASDSELDIAMSAMLNPSTPRSALEIVVTSEDAQLSALASALVLRRESIASGPVERDASN